MITPSARKNGRTVGHPDGVMKSSGIKRILKIEKSQLT